MISLPEFLERVRLRWLERVVYTRIAKPFSVSVEEIPPLIPAVLSGDVVFNSESEKKSVYLESGSKPTGEFLAYKTRLIAPFLLPETFDH